MKTLPLDVVYAVWSAGGAGGIALAAALVPGRRPDPVTTCGLVLTVTGTALVLGARAHSPDRRPAAVRPPPTAPTG